MTRFDYRCGFEGCRRTVSEGQRCVDHRDQLKKWYRKARKPAITSASEGDKSAL